MIEKSTLIKIDNVQWQYISRTNYLKYMGKMKLDDTYNHISFFILLQHLMNLFGVIKRHFFHFYTNIN